MEVVGIELVRRPIPTRHVSIVQIPRTEKNWKAGKYKRQRAPYAPGFVKSDVSKKPPLFLIPSLSRASSAPFPSLIFMNSRTAEASVFSCKSGNKNNLFFVWILFCLLPKFLGTPFAIVNLAIDRIPSRALAVETFG
ncbi:hypothetical protein D8674_007926 [Pyrus ussuriensis x Pyrus communis]|uniref:Uncharacterized protein n=1 Tax=Pyrus ussuriensis x Pyrus communis TaxID=2448454 RepID=A0A5N5HU73_9ROSA|nr:hypothetical protein D8674_007926 [Pyrus ussuriensis x Pyrus communis]